MTSLAINADQATTVRDVWLGILEANIVRDRPESGLMVDETSATPLGILCVVAYQFPLWPASNPDHTPRKPTELEFPPFSLCAAIGLRCARRDEDEAYGGDIDWINAMSDWGVDDRTIGRVIEDVLRNRSERGGAA